ncbi:MAG: MFS transporter [Chloroflexota bacterium]|nr:MFS transporter [Chloroflexota bacterium]
MPDPRNASAPTRDQALAARPEKTVESRRGAWLHAKFPAFRYRNYRLFWSGQLVSITGRWMQTVAQAWLVVDELDATAFQLSLVTSLQFAPILLFGLFAGVLADRMPKRNLLLATQVAMAILASILAVLVATGTVELWHVFVLALGLGIANAFDMPARQAFVSEMVDREAVMSAVALNSAVFNSGRIVGPAIAGVLLAAFGPAICFGLNAISYVGVIVALLKMRLRPVRGDASGSPVASLREGLAYVRATPDILRPTLLVGLIGIFGMNFNVWLPLLTRESFAAGATAFGLLFAAMGVGSLSGALGLAALGSSPDRGRMYVTGLGLGAALLLLALTAALPGGIWLASACLAAAGFVTTMTTATANTLVQTTASDELRGRVMAVYSTVFAGTIPIGALIAGTVAGLAGASVSVAIGGAIVAGGTLALASLARRSRTSASPATARADAGSVAAGTGSLNATTLRRRN